MTWRPEKGGKETALIDFGWILVVGCPSYCIVCWFCRWGMLLSTFVLVVAYVILLSRQPTHLTSSCVKESDFQNLCGRCYRVISGYRCYTNSPKNSHWETMVTNPLPGIPWTEDGNDPWFAVFRLMTKEDLHKATRIGCEKSWSTTLQGSNISLLNLQRSCFAICAAGCFLQRMFVSRRYLCKKCINKQL